jgi:periplasmic mercuric ion binding protein
MKTLQILLLSFSFTLICSGAFAQKGSFNQTKTETFGVSGECGQCKKKIETAAKDAGATYAVWNVKSKELTVKYNSESSNTAKIQQRIADAGYDTPLAKASDSAYNSLDECCQYDRATKTSQAGAKAEETTCCTKDAACCKDGATCCAKH